MDARTKIEEVSSSPPFHRRPSTYLFLVLTSLYLVVEAAYNIGLIRVLSSPTTTRETLEGMEVIGKTLASVGISLAVVKLISRWRIPLFVLLSVSLYFSFGVLIDRTIDGLPPAMKRIGHYIGHYRIGLLNGSIDDPEIGGNARLPPESKRLAMANIALLGTDRLGHVERKVRQYADTIFKKEVSVRFTEADFEHFWKRYSLLSESVRPIWERYRGERIPGGILEDNEKGRLLFINRLKIDAARQYRDSIIFQGKKELDIPAVRGGEIAPFKSKEELRAWLDRFMQESRDKVSQQIAPRAGSDFSKNRFTNDLSSSVFVPPISIALSLVAFGINLVSLAVTILLLVASMILPGGLRRFGGLWQTGMTMAIALLVAVLVTAPSEPFPKGTEFRSILERAAESGSLFKAWAIAIGAEDRFYRYAETIPALVQLADALPSLGQSIRAGAK